MKIGNKAKKRLNPLLHKCRLLLTTCMHCHEWVGIRWSGKGSSKHCRGVSRGGMCIPLCEKARKFYASGKKICMWNLE